MKNRVIHFEIHADDPERAAVFYKTVFGWEIKKWENDQMEYWMVMTAEKGSEEPGIDGGLMRRQGGSPTENQSANSYVCTVLVDNIDETAEKIEKAGGTLAMPKFPIADMAWQAYYKDTEGNIFGIHEPTEKMKQMKKEQGL